MKTNKLKFSPYSTSFYVIIFLLIFIFITGILFTPVIIVSGNVRSFLLETLQQKGLVTAHSVVNVLQKDIELYRKLYETENYASDNFDQTYYQEANSMLQDFTEISDAACIVTEKHIGDSEIRYILNGTDPGSGYFSPIGSIGSMKEAELQAFRKQEPGVTELIDDPVRGKGIAAFVPVIDPRDDTFLGLAGVYYSAEQLNNTRQRAAAKLIAVLIPLAFLLTIVDHRILIHLLKENSLDHLTKLGSRKYLHKALHHVMIMSSRDHGQFGAAMLDIDRFKVINDNEGHSEGDKILIQLSSLLLHNTRDNDVCLRIGGDEFVVLFPNCTEAQCKAIADRILLRAKEIFSTGGRQVTLSIGITVSSNKQNAHAVLKKADTALYQAKENGRDQIVVYRELES